MVKIRIEFISSKVLKADYGITLGQVLDYIETQYIKVFLALLEKMVRNNSYTLSRVKIDKLMNNEDETDKISDDDEENGSKNKNASIKKNKKMKKKRNSNDTSSRVDKNSANNYTVLESESSLGESDSNSDVIEPSSKKQYASYENSETNSDNDDSTYEKGLFYLFV